MPDPSTERGALSSSAGSAGGARPREDALEDGPGSLVAFPQARAPKRLPHNLPLQLSSFVGREREIAEVEKLLADYRLLTLTGPGVRQDAPCAQGGPRSGGRVRGWGMAGGAGLPLGP